MNEKSGEITTGNAASKPPTEQQLPADIERVEELTSLLVDEVISDEQAKELEALLASSDEARACYLSIMQLHTDLNGYFKADNKPSLQSPVLGSLGGNDSGIFNSPLNPAD